MEVMSFSDNSCYSKDSEIVIAVQNTAYGLGLSGLIELNATINWKLKYKAFSYNLGNIY